MWLIRTSVERNKMTREEKKKNNNRTSSTVFVQVF